MFLGFGKRYSLPESGVFRGLTDYHSHILPGVDDGVQTLEESLQILSAYESLGVKTIWLTPHIMEDVPNRVETLRERFSLLQAAYNEQKSPSHEGITLCLAAENMLDNLFDERLAQNDLLPLGDDGDHLLVETSYFNPPMGLYDTLERIKSKGYHPVLAHPERYEYMVRSDYCELKAAGIKFQLNLFSLTDYYGVNIRKKAEWLLKENYIDIYGTDIHRNLMLKRGLPVKTLKSPLPCKTLE